MAIEKYRNKHTWHDSSIWGVHEELLAEGVSAGRSWALVRQWRPKPRHESQRGESYVIKIDLSEFYYAYDICIMSKHNDIMNVCMKIRRGTGFIKNAWFRHQSPGWWNNGFIRQLCIEATLFKYESESDRINQVVTSGVDWDTIDYDKAVTDLCADLKPVFDLFIETGRIGVPDDDDF